MDIGKWKSSKAELTACCESVKHALGRAVCCLRPRFRKEVTGGRGDRRGGDAHLAALGSDQKLLVLEAASMPCWGASGERYAARRSFTSLRSCGVT